MRWMETVLRNLLAFPLANTYAIVSRMRKVISALGDHGSRSYVGQTNLQDRSSSLVKFENKTFGEVNARVIPLLSKSEG